MEHTLGLLSRSVLISVKSHKFTKKISAIKIGTNNLLCSSCRYSTASCQAKFGWSKGRGQELITQPRRHYTNRNLLTLQERGLISDIFPNKPTDFKNLCVGSPQTVYAGFDPTADSLHVGNLAILMVLLQCQRAGHTPIALIGGATGLIGDPSGKNVERPELPKDDVRSNATVIKKQIEHIFRNHAELFWDSKNGKEELPKYQIVNNKKWYEQMTPMQFFGKIGRHFRIGDLISRSSVQSRLKSEEGISFTEFSYQIFQSYDWQFLFENHNCTIQLGGHDQMGNIVSGHDLIRKACKKHVFGITVPLITSETGDKYGKTAGNAVWLDHNKTSAFKMLQFFVRTPDSEVERLLKIFTFRKEDEIQALMKRHEMKPEQRLAQFALAEDVTKLVHGASGFNLAIKATNVLYSEDVDSLSSLPAEDVSRLFKGTKTSFAHIILEPGTTVLTMALKAKCFDTEKDAKRIISAGGFSLNYRKISNYDEMVVPGIHILANKISLARVGKKNYHVIQWSP